MSSSKEQIAKAFNFLTDLSNIVDKASTQNEYLVERLNLISPEGKQALRNRYQGANDKVKGLRRAVAEALQERNVTLQELENIITSHIEQDPNVFKRMYTTWYNILYPFVLQDYETEMKQSMNIISMTVMDQLGPDLPIKCTKYDFRGERHTGGKRAWLAFYNSAHAKQDTAKQLFIDFTQGSFYYCVFDFPNKQQIDKVSISDTDNFEFNDLIHHFKAHLPEIITDKPLPNAPTLIHLEPGQRVYKISMGTDHFDLATFDDLMKMQLVVVHEDTPALAQMNQSQADIFINEMQIGDLFYVCRGNSKVELVGRITGDAEVCSYNKSWGEDGWLQRSFEVMKEAENKTPYNGISKWWAPNFRSTCYYIKHNEIEVANTELFDPHFGIRFIYNMDTQSDSGMLGNEKRTPEEVDLNTILYGPPGTGKTYSCIDEAVKIFNYDFYIDNAQAGKRDALRDYYNQLVADGYIQFVTFHQSLSYEDFVEGIKPELDHSSDDAELKTSSQLGYTVKAGIFKQMCAQAAYECFRYGDSRKQNKAEITFDQLYEAFLDEMQLKMRLKEPIEFQTISGNTVVLKRINKNGSIITQAKDSSPTRRNEPAPKTKENFRKLWETYSSMEQLPNLQQIKEVLQISPGISGFYAVFAALKEFKNVLARRYNAIEGIFEDEGLSDDAIVKQFEEGRFDEYVSAHAAHAKPFILIIDEINRGNIAAIFGELITLIENDKRLGRDEGLKLRLPYSNTLFYVPANLYIIGTMNTADRSVEALDTALRRRFTFSEKGPEPETLSATIEGIDLRALLSTINSRLEILIDRDHTLGHAWFIKVKKLDELRTVFAQKIIPLLKEFFFNDYGKIGLILGNAFIEPVNRLDKGIFADFEDADDYDTFLDRKQYHFNDVNRITAESFKKIYATNTGMAVLPAFTESGSINVN